MLAAAYNLARPLLFGLDPEQAHELALRALNAGLHPRPEAPDDASLGVTAWGLALPNPLGMAAGPDRLGEQIYQQQCASCHGTAGEGTDDHYPRPLTGDRSVEGLARLIARTMPEDDPGTCVGADAQKVAAYIYDKFYSKAAQARNPFPKARIELSRPIESGTMM